MAEVITAGKSGALLSHALAVTSNKFTQKAHPVAAEFAPIAGMVTPSE